MNRIVSMNDPIFDSIFAGVVSLEKTEKGIQPWRLPHQDQDYYRDASNRLIDRAQSSSGVRIRFQTNSSHFRLNYRLLFNDIPDPLKFALVKDNKILEIAVIEKSAYSADFSLPESGIYEIWLHPFFGFRITSIEIDDFSDISIPPDNRKKWVTYGSSITMGSRAGNGAGTWPGVAARELDLNLTSLGFGGECHLDPLIPDVILDQNPDILTLKLGINIYGQSSLNLRTFRTALMGLIYRIRQSRRDLPIGLISPIVFPSGEDTQNPVGMTLKDYRLEIETAYKILIQGGDSLLSYTHGYELLGPAEAAMMPDGLHPGPEGYQLMGERAAAKVLPRLLELKKIQK